MRYGASSTSKVTTTAHINTPSNALPIPQISSHSASSAGMIAPAPSTHSNNADTPLEPPAKRQKSASRDTPESRNPFHVSAFQDPVDEVKPSVFQPLPQRTQSEGSKELAFASQAARSRKVAGATAKSTSGRVSGVSTGTFQRAQFDHIREPRVNSDA